MIRDGDPAVTKQHRERVEGYVDLGVKEGSGARSRRPPGSSAAGSRATRHCFFMGGCLFDQVTPEMDIVQGLRPRFARNLAVGGARASTTIWPCAW